jgi:hypothetical protein
MKNHPLVICALLCAFGIFTSAYSQTTYNIYYGDNHSHTWYSDGNEDKTPASFPLPVAQSITWARNNRSSLDFMGISDHNHNESLNMTLAYWRSGVREADSVNQDGNFVGMFGQEWGTISGGGHVLVYGTDKLFGWNPGVYDVYVAKSDYARLWDSVKKYNGYCYLAHPNTSDFGSLATSAYNVKADSVIRGVAMKSGNAFSTNITETDPDAGDYTSYFHSVLAKGYHFAPIANQDNHNTTFGKSNQQRTAILATSLTKANVDDAFRNRRVYATEDHNLQVQFEVGTHRMGEIFSMTGGIPIRVKAIDPDAGESISRVEIRYGVPGSGSAPTTLQYVTSRDSLVFTQTQSVGTTYYYYAYVVEADGHRAWTAPMWITITASSAPGAFNLLSPSNVSTNRPVSGTLTWQTSTGATSYDVYTGTTNPPTTKINVGTATSYNYSGLSYSTIYYWKVVAKNATDSTSATGSPWSFTTIVAPPAAFSMTSPANSAIGQPVSGTLTWTTSTNATGYDVYLGTTNPPASKISSNQSGTTYNYSGLSNNTIYYWKIVARNVNDTIVATGAPWSFTTVQAAPGAFTLSSPANDAVSQPITGMLIWAVSANATGYDVYFDNTNPPATKVSSNQPGTSYSYNDLSYSTIYYWKIIAKNSVDSIAATGSPWSFTTTIAPPAAFSLLSPANGGTGQPLSGILQWTTSMNVSAYDIYLGTSNPPVIKIDSNLTDTIYSYTNLIPDSTYYWTVVAKNTGGNASATGTPWSFTLASLPHAPTSLIVSNRSISNLEIDWTDNASNELGYRVYRALSESGPYSQLGGDLPPNTVSFNDSALNVNQRYYYNIVPFNEYGEGAYTSINVATLSNVPGKPTITEIQSSTFTIAVVPGDNPAPTQFAIAVVNADTKYVHADGTVGVNPVWRTYVEWGGMSGTSVHGLSACQTHTVNVFARNLDSIETLGGEGDSAVMSCNEMSLSVSEGWNLISVPVKVNDARSSTLFPTAQSSAFAYNGSYIVADTLVVGAGYWLKFNAGETISMFGDYCATDTIQLSKGWNIIGSISTPVDIHSVVTDPPNIIVSNYYSYTNGYVAADTIYPAKAYWVKTDSDGKLILSSGSLTTK